MLVETRAYAREIPDVDTGVPFRYEAALADGHRHSRRQKVNKYDEKAKGDPLGRRLRFQRIERKRQAQ